MKNNCPQHLILRFKKVFPNHTPIVGNDGELSEIWDDIADDRERGGITEAMFDYFDGLIPVCAICGGNGSNALHPLCFSCENEENRSAHG